MYIMAPKPYLPKNPQQLKNVNKGRFCPKPSPKKPRSPIGAVEDRIPPRIPATPLLRGWFFSSVPGNPASPLAPIPGVGVVEGRFSPIGISCDFLERDNACRSDLGLEKGLLLTVKAE